MTSRDGFASAAERQVDAVLRAGLRDGDRLWANVRVTNEKHDHELDTVFVRPGAGVVILEVKGGQVTHTGEHWLQTGQNGRSKRIDPVRQARDGKYALRRYVEHDPRWGSRARIRWAHAIVLPFTSVPEDFAVPSCPRSMIFGRDDLDDLADRLSTIPLQQDASNRVPTPRDVETIQEVLSGRALPQADVIGFAAEREAMADRLTEQQGLILSVSQLMRRVEVRGGAGSGKTWLALEQARRLRKVGERVALVCYSRGLAAYFTAVTAQWERRERPSYVGTFHGLGIDEWGADPSPAGDDDSEYWECRLPDAMVAIAAQLPEGQRFDTIVVDEAQDFADSWWPAVRAALRDPDSGGLFLLSDEGQRVFARFGGMPECQAVLVLEHNLRNTRQIAETFQSLGSTRMRLRGGDGPQVRFVACTPQDAVAGADDAVDDALERGWRPQDVALLTTGPRHPEQAQRQAAGQDAYWASFWDDDQVFYGHVLGFKGLERPVVVLAVNESDPRDRARERLYVGLSRARDELIVCGDPDYLERIGAHDLVRLWTRCETSE